MAFLTPQHTGRDAQRTWRCAWQGLSALCVWCTTLAPRRTVEQNVCCGSQRTAEQQEQQACCHLHSCVSGDTRTTGDAVNLQ